MCYIIYFIINYEMFCPCFKNKIFIFTYYKEFGVGLFSLCVSRGGGHFETQLPGYINIECINSTKGKGDPRSK